MRIPAVALIALACVAPHCVSAAPDNQANKMLGGLFGGRVSVPAPSNCESPAPQPSP